MKVHSGALPLAMMMALSCGVRVFSQAARPIPERIVNSNTAGASCYDDATGKLLGSELVRSDVFASPDGRFRAYTENEARAFSPQKNRCGLECANTARLFVARPGADRFEVVFLQEPDRNLLDNGLWLVDWSPDSRYLLLQLYLIQYRSDFGGLFTLLFDAYHGVFWPREFADQALIDYVGRTCPSVIEPQGFSPGGNVILKISPYYEVGEEKPDQNSCVKKEGLWSLDPREGKLSPLPGNYTVQRYGRYLKHPPGAPSDRAQKGREARIAP